MLKLFITADWHLQPRETSTKRSRTSVQGFGSTHSAPIARRNEASSIPGRASTNKASLTSLKRYEGTQPLAPSDFIIAPKLIEVWETSRVPLQISTRQSD